MRHSAKWITAVLILLVVGLVGSVAAQKGKPVPAPTYVWTVTLPGEDVGQNIYGPGTPYVSGVNGVTASAYYNGCDGCDVSGFKLALSAPSNLSTLPWIGFQGLEDESGAIASPCKYPTFDLGGVLLSSAEYAPQAGRSCVLDFLSHKNPQWPYLGMRLEIQVQHIDVLNMKIGSPEWPNGLLFTNITGSTCTSTPYAYSNVAGYQLRLEDHTVKVTRVSDNVWEVELADFPLVVGEWLNVPGKGQKCDQPFTNALARTLPINATLTWERTRR